MFYVIGYKQGLVKALKKGRGKGKPFLFKKMTWKKIDQSPLAVRQD